MYIRNAVISDAKACAPLIYSSAAPKFDYGIGAFGDNPIDVIEDAFKHYAVHFHKVVESDGQVVGVAAFHTHKDTRKVAIKALRWVINYYGIFKFPKLISRLTTLTKMQNPTANDTLYITNIAVRPESRGQGFASALIKSFEEDAKAQGLKVALDVAADNTDAIMLYEHLGFEYQWQKSFAGNPLAHITDSCRYVKVSTHSHSRSNHNEN